jgi:hypothetical protein
MLREDGVRAMTDPSRACRGALCLAGFSIAAVLAAGCSPVIRVAAPEKPIEINVNVRVEQDVKVTVDPAAEKMVGKNPAGSGGAQR